MLKSVQEKPSGAEYRERRAEREDEFEECENL
jgi:hypothetical protein